MKTKNSVIILILIAAIAVGAFLFLNSPNRPAALTIQDVKILDNTKPFKINVVYPQIAGMDSFNNTVKNFIDKQVSDFKKNSLANDQAVKEVDPINYAKYPREYELVISYDKGEVDSGAVSVILNIYGFEGGAHGFHASVAVNYNPKTNSAIKLSDLFPGQPDYLQKISDYCIKDLKTQMTKSGAFDMSGDDWLAEGAGPKEENFLAFLINKNNITFYFGDYQVAAYAAGDFKVITPR